jgi:hypothetical protein
MMNYTTSRDEEISCALKQNLPSKIEFEGAYLTLKCNVNGLQN